MTRPDPHGAPLPVLIALTALLCWAPRAEAQFETPNRQFHNETTFPLDGRHRDLTCESCHEGGVYKGTPTTCFDCHWERRQDDRFRLQLGSQCEQCHRTTAWSAVNWNHETLTGMSLGVAHRQLTCQSCHANDRFQASQTTCMSCHEQDYQATRTPNHAAAGFPTTCETCHRVSDSTFAQARFDHAAAFPLMGVHALQTCATCHTGNVFAGTARDCVGCHRPLYERTTAPNHAAAGFPTTCENCHRPTDPNWGSGSGSGFNHSAVFPLVGVHAQQACATCHVNNVFAGTARDCVGCHRPLYERTTAPNHAAAGFPTTCENCHRPTDPNWGSGSGGGFNHSAVFPLVGVHAQQACATCHVNNVFAGTARDCVGCHRPLYDQTTAPIHAAAGFPTTCESCHRAADSAWTQGTFNHRFPITSGPHRQSCATCHQGGGTFQTFTCLTCHEHDRARMDDKHKERAGYRYDSLACYSCHPNGRH